jgi:hypothetical protein
MRDLAFAGRPLQDGVQRTRRQGVAKVTGNGDALWLGRVLQLAVAASLVDDDPSIAAKQPKNVAHLHAAR